MNLNRDDIWYYGIKFTLVVFGLILIYDAIFVIGK
jgi:hypothetical protein